jgi:hypothetical protein
MSQKVRLLVESHSGLLDSVDAAGQRLTLQEMLPWTGPDPCRIMRSIAIPPDTRVRLVRRLAETDVEVGRRQDIDSPLKMADLRPGDFVTVTVMRHGRWLAAVTIEVERG